MATLACNFVSDKSASGEQLLNGVGGQVGIQVVDRAEVPHFRAIEGLDELSSSYVLLQEALNVQSAVSCDFRLDLESFSAAVL